MPIPEEIPGFNAEALDEATDEMLEGSLRSSQWRELVKALLVRRKMFLRELDKAAPEEKPFLEQQIEELEGQIQVLAEEENITGFIEDTVKFSYEVHRLSQG